MFTMARDINGFNTFGIETEPLNANIRMTASVEDIIPVPATYSKWFAAFSPTPGDNYYVAINSVPEIPAGPFIEFNKTKKNPSVIVVKGGDEIHIISSVSVTEVGIALFPKEQ